MTAADDLDLFGHPAMYRNADFVHGDRIRLERAWAPGPRACVIGHNPSVGDGRTDDPTIKWWINWFRHYGFGSFVAVNLYPFVTPDPAECRRRANWYATNDWAARDQLHFVNLPAVVKEARDAVKVFACWGAIAMDADWVEHVVEQIQTAGEPHIWCWGKTKSGAPTHPMARGNHRIDALQPAILWRSAA